MEIKIKKLRPDAMIPAQGSEYAAGFDLYACMNQDELGFCPHQTRMIGTGISLAIPEGYFGGIYPRSGLSIKQGLRPGNCVGVVDADFRGEVMVALHNDFIAPKKIQNGDRIAQLIIQPCAKPTFVETDELGETERGSGGFGSTGTK